MKENDNGRTHYLVISLTPKKDYLQGSYVGPNEKPFRITYEMMKEDPYIRERVDAFIDEECPTPQNEVNVIYSSYWRKRLTGS